MLVEAQAKTRAAAVQIAVAKPTQEPAWTPVDEICE